MNDKLQLRKIVADVAGISATEIEPGFLLNKGGLQGSIGRVKLDAALRRHFGIVTKQVNSVQTYSELENLVYHSSSDSSPKTESRDSTVERPVEEMVVVEDDTPWKSFPKIEGIGCGVDLELVSNFSEEQDYWESEFYRSNFTEAEIAYCVSQEFPTQHFAARWCAKEALRKCAQDYLDLPMSTIEVMRERSGKPLLCLRNGKGREWIPASVSLSHTPAFAIAMVVMIEQKG